MLVLFQLISASRDDKPEKLSELDGKLHPELFGVAYLGKNIYVVEANNNTIQVFVIHVCLSKRTSLLASANTQHVYKIMTPKIYLSRSVAY